MCKRKPASIFCYSLLSHTLYHDRTLECAILCFFVNPAPILPFFWVQRAGEPAYR